MKQLTHIVRAKTVHFTVLMSFKSEGGFIVTEVNCVVPLISVFAATGGLWAAGTSMVWQTDPG